MRTAAAAAVPRLFTALVVVVVVVITTGGAQAFVPTVTKTTPALTEAAAAAVISRHPARTSTTTTTTTLHEQQQQERPPPPPSPTTKKSNSNGVGGGGNGDGGLEEGLRNKLVTESIAPWRSLRLFLYGTLGIGALVGGLINTSGAVANSSRLDPTDFNLQTELMNIGIDFGAVLLMGLLAKFDLDRQSSLQSKVDEKIQRKKELKAVVKAMRDREKALRSLPLEIVVSADGATTQQASVAELQAGAKQHMIIVAGPRKACKEALIGAKLLQMDFAMRNVLVVPYQTDGDTAQELSRPNGGAGGGGGGGGGGFGERPSYETQPYIARPVGDDWDDFIQEELQDAITQGGDNVKRDGIALVVANNGKVIRRGVGTVPWRQMVEQLEKEVNPKEAGPLPWI